MFIIDVDLKFYSPEESKSSLKNNLDAHSILRLDFEFSDDCVAIGSILADSETNIFILGNLYHAIIDLAIQYAENDKNAMDKTIKKNAVFKMRVGSRIVGIGKVLDVLSE
jgi:hypothetical protein